MKILIDNGHGSNTSGKRSPDGRLMEYAYTREIADMVVNELKKLGYDAERLVKEEIDVPLKERCRRANEYKSMQAIVVSIHNDAKGIGKDWEDARGWSVRVSLNASSKSKKLATCLAEEAEKKGLKVRREYPKKAYWAQDLAICRDTKCPAVLTENLFQDNKEDAEFLLSPEGKRTIRDVHVEGIIKYLSL